MSVLIFLKTRKWFVFLKEINIMCEFRQMFLISTIVWIKSTQWKRNWVSTRIHRTRMILKTRTLNVSSNNVWLIMSLWFRFIFVVECCVCATYDFYVSTWCLNEYCIFMDFYKIIFSKTLNQFVAMWLKL